MRRPGRISRGPATAKQREHLTALHIDVYGYVTAQMAEEIAAMSWLRCAQETATLTRAKADKDALARARVELKDLHRDLFGRDDEKLRDIDLYDAHRCYSELTTLRRMVQTRQQDRQAALAASLARARKRVLRAREASSGDGPASS